MDTASALVWCNLGCRVLFMYVMSGTAPSASQLEEMSPALTALGAIVSPRLAHDSPIYRLPEEILSEITLLSMLPLDSSVWKSPVMAVSSWWRACAINTPRIWSCIVIAPVAHSSERFKIWLQRSGNGCPLHLDVGHIEGFNTLQVSWLNGASSPGERIRSIYLSPSIVTETDDAFPFPLQFDCSNLHDLDINIPPRNEEDHSSTTYRLFSLEPPKNLRNLKLVSWGDTLVELTGMGTSSLTSLILMKEISPSHLLGIIAGAPQLQWLECDLDTYVSPLPSYAVPIMLPAFHRLVLHGDDILADLLSVIDAPNLQQLSVEGAWASTRFPSILAFAMACKELVHFYIFHSAQETASARDIASLLHALPKLEYLDPEWCDSNLEGLLALSIPMGLPKPTSTIHPYK
ncbi:hypothetical protein DL93DRAFT_2230473 [Clavulina sp. PMI_390]|nr:hypothetical protein DL93DRAFT_2230473 [Clavulina sp. PMI_390]